jgi:hypothetical protein
VRLIKLGLISIIFFALLITGFSLFIPSRIIISKAINIGVKRDSIKNQLVGIENWKKWYPGFDTLQLLELDKKNGKVLSAKTMGISIVLSSITDSVIVAEFRSNTKKPIINNWQTITYPHTDSVTLQWSMNFRLKWYPWEKFSSLLLEKRYGPQMEQGLANLKGLLEKNAER